MISYNLYLIYLIEADYQSLLFRFDWVAVLHIKALSRSQMPQILRAIARAWGLSLERHWREASELEKSIM